MITFLRKLPADILPRQEADDIISESLEPLRASEAGRCQLVEVFRFMSAVMSLPDTTGSTLYAEVKRCTTAEDIRLSRVSQLVCMQQELVQLQGVQIADPGWES